jgi:hypothetical protein
MKLVGTLLAAGIAAVVLSGCAAQFKDIEVRTEADPDVNLSTYSTYMWAAEAAVIRDPEGKWNPGNIDIGAEIVFLANRELRNRGYSEVVSDPGLLAIYAVGIDMMSLNVTFDEEDRARFEEVPKGGVAVVLADAETRNAVWVGSAVAELLEEPDEELSKKRVDYAITQMFKSLPRSASRRTPATP